MQSIVNHIKLRKFFDGDFVGDVAVFSARSSVSSATATCRPSRTFYTLDWRQQESSRRRSRSKDTASGRPIRIRRPL